MQPESDNTAFKNALARAKKACSSKERTESEVSRMLGEWGMDEDGVAKIINLLKAEKYIDDNRYVSSFINDRVKFQKWGMIKIRYALSGKGLSSEITARAIEEFDSEEYLSMIKNELMKKQRVIKGDIHQIKHKLISFGMSRGYEYENMLKALNDIL